MELLKIAAFCTGDTGGNPAGVAFVDAMPADDEMLAVARALGYSETAFLERIEDGWRTRYFAPETEVPFCGHATIASAAALGARHGAGRYRLVLNDAAIEVNAESIDGRWSATLQSPPTWSRDAPDEMALWYREAFSIADPELDASLPIRLAHAGATHLVIPLASRQRLAHMNYPFDAVRSAMAEHEVTTVSLIWSENPHRYHSRNAFAVGGVVEDPATGAAAAALGGYLRDTGRLASGRIEILQGQDMGQPCRLEVAFTATAGASVSVGGLTRVLA